MVQMQEMETRWKPGTAIYSAFVCSYTLHRILTATMNWWWLGDLGNQENGAPLLKIGNIIHQNQIDHSSYFCVITNTISYNKLKYIYVNLVTNLVKYFKLFDSS